MPTRSHRAGTAEASSQPSATHARAVSAVAAPSATSVPDAAAQATANSGRDAADHQGREPLKSQPRARAASGGTVKSASQVSRSAAPGSSSIAPTTTAIDPAGRSPSTPIETQNGSIRSRVLHRAPQGPPNAAVELLPLDRRRGLRGDVEGDAVDAADLIDDPVRGPLEQVVGEPRPVGGHRVVGGDGADHDRIGVGAAVTLNAHRAHHRQHAEGLPELAIEAGGADLLLEDRVGGAEDVEALPVHLAADDADRQAGAREGLAPDEALGQAELGADRADLVLEEQPQRLDQLELEVLG